MTDDERAIRDLVARWHSASRAGDVDTVLSLMTEDVVFLLPGRPPMNKAEFAELSRPPADAAPPSLDSEFDIRELVVSGDWAYLRSDISLRLTFPDGRRMVRSGPTLTIFRREQNVWRLARDANLMTTRND